MSAVNKVLNRLLEGQELSPAQIAGGYRIANPSSTIEDIREKGFAVYTNETKRGTKYRLGTPNAKTLREGAQILGEDHPAVLALVSAAFEQKTANELGMS